ncbi:hypothetical protein TTHERM_000433489 (macronuclear) [Tetrahymena thermophila SB210]|uniref:Uncharacterized protein n=1 Tax=Tetrahymena thermophila (strain SB210) TaxID=312017 RepID=W7X0G2_TETTS|nr:hypothetical protein TTHERM_000433489 [Tetrahymena thermophila SB210]EWS72610.1 hypothetical protein TTHERM_000433489 [Tetrahymena thermophila SB210]|eukprot:XP_012654893.1 hypothetical protein TTHERM_000433489 [Tetrahymena thermophila SB210]
MEVGNYCSTVPVSNYHQSLDLIRLFNRLVNTENQRHYHYFYYHEQQFNFQFNCLNLNQNCQFNYQTFIYLNYNSNFNHLFDIILKSFTHFSGLYLYSIYYHNLNCLRK